jgi:hypothetical protein
MDLKELLQFTSESTLQFFYTELRDTTAARDLSQLEALHVASMLSHYAHVSSAAPTTEMPPPAGIDDVSRRLVVLDGLSVEELRDQMTVRIAAAQCLFALAFYAAWLENRRHMAWLEDHGRTYYRHTSNLSKTDNDKRTFALMSMNFAAWVRACREMQEGLRDRPLLL